MLEASVIALVCYVFSIASLFSMVMLPKHYFNKTWALALEVGVLVITTLGLAALLFLISSTG